eukprot:GHVT01007242.1.p1 GENE.GHVT01007242.1~~GHVT01007242.1.p1  ORF type:complete len:123 (+),score=11.11 GHVT01007242.1:343-711(+)
MAVGFSPGPLLCNLCRSRGVRLAAARSNPNRYGVDVLNYPMLPSRRRMHTPVDRINMDMTAAEDPVPSHRRLVAGGHQPWLHSDLQVGGTPFETGKRAHASCLPKRGKGQCRRRFAARQTSN